ncbi:MAG: hypothetical protein QOG59_153, partial [Solirubrobacteraceae bacterium]|nr:hypothetical protein [Solirubrobacteraceae bacterium]
AYADERLAGAGGPVYDATGVNLQYRYAVCDRIGHTVFDRDSLPDAVSRPEADPFVYLQGTNMSFRRTALEAVGGFDENIEYIYDDVDIAMQVIDRGGQIQSLDTGFVHHKVLPSGLRREKGEITDPFVPVKNRSYFAVRSGRGRRPVEEIIRSLTEYLDVLRAHANSAEQNERFSPHEARHFVARMEAGFQAGFTQGFEAPRAGRSLAGPDEAAFKPYPVIDAVDRRLSVCLVSVDFPPKPMGGIARYTVDWARGMAAAGHEVHVVTQAEAPYRLEFEDGVWVHRYPGGERWLPSLDGHPLRENLAHVAAVWRTVAAVAERFPLDLVAGNVWLAEVMACALDPRWPTVMTLSTPIRTIASTQPAVASKPEVAWQIELEDIALRQADQLHPLSQANLDHVREYSPAAADVPAEVVWLGMADRATTENPPGHDWVEILFVGRLEPRKGIETLLQAAVPLLTERPEVRLRVVGADNPYASEDPRPYAERVRERLADHPDVLSRITFEGELSETRLDHLFQACDIFCAPSLYESFGLMNLEAMMFSRPVVSCRVGGIPEVVVHEETGLLVEPDDEAGLLDALRTLVDAPTLRRRLGQAGRGRYETEFTNERAVERILKLFASTVRRVPGQNTTPERAEQEVRERFAEVIGDLAGIEAPSQAAAELLEPRAFPHDYRAAIARLEGTADDEFIAGLYQSILRREPDDEGLKIRTALLANGLCSRAQVVRDIATSPEARLLGVDARFVEGLRPEAPPEMVRQVRGAFWRDDELFAALLADVLLSPEASRDAEVQALVGALAAGADRHAVLTDLVSRSDVRDRLPDARALLRERFLTTDDLAAGLSQLAERDDSAFVAGLYQLLLGREPEPDGAAGTVARLRTVTRRQVIGEIASSVEATRRGVDPSVVAEVVDASGAFDRPPPSMAQRLQTLPGGRRVRGAARRVLRDPQVRQLGAQIHELETMLEAQARDSQAREVARQNAVTQAAASIDRVTGAIRELGLETDDRRQRLANELLERLGDDVGRRVAQELSSRLSPDGLRETRDAITAELLQRLPRAGSYGTYLGDGRIVVGMTWGGMLLTPADDLSLTPELVTRGIYEAPFTRYLMRTLKPGQHAVDVGANIGMYTVLMAAWVGERGRVLAYEPNPEVLSFLRENVAMNWLNKRVEIRALGVSNAQERVTLHVTSRFMANSSLLKPDDTYFAHAPMDTVREVEVDAEPLDLGARDMGGIAIVKIDVEGAEDGVIAGMEGLLGDGLVERVSFEVYRERMGPAWRPFCDRLRGYAGRGWRFHQVTDDGGLLETDLEELIDVGRYSQVVMCRPD